MQIKYFKLNKYPGAKKASFLLDCPIGDGMRFEIQVDYFQKDNGQSWLGYPQRDYVTKEGEKKYFTLCRPGKESRIEFERRVMQALKDQEPLMEEIIGASVPEELPF